MLYLQTLGKLCHDPNFVVDSEISRYDKAIKRYGFRDNYLNYGNGFVNGGVDNDVMNSGVWLAILQSYNNLDLKKGKNVDWYDKIL
jgi:hypothetical protein